MAKNRKVMIKDSSGIETEIRLDEYAKSLLAEDFEQVVLNLDKPKNLFIATFTAQISRLEGVRTFAIVMNANSFDEATDIDYFITWHQLT